MGGVSRHQLQNKPSKRTGDVAQAVKPGSPEFKPQLYPHKKKSLKGVHSFAHGVLLILEKLSRHLLKILV
jgi:hypothetical protein